MLFLLLLLFLYCCFEVDRIGYLLVEEGEVEYILYVFYVVECDSSHVLDRKSVV